MNRKFFVVAAVIILAVAAGLAGTLVAQGPGHGHGFGPGFGRHGGWMFGHMARELNLTDAQKAQIKTIMQAQHAKVQPIMQQMRQNQQAQDAAVSGTFDEAQARSFAGKQSQLMADLIVEKQRTRSQIYAVLTPEQQQKAQQLMQQREQRRQDWMQKRQERMQKHMERMNKPQPQAAPAK